MEHQKSELYFLLALLLVVGIFTFFIFSPFLYAIFFAIVFATLFAPLHNKISKFLHRSSGLASFITTISILLIVIIPTIFLGIQILQEATSLYSFIVTGGAIKNFSSFFPASIDFSSLDISQYLQQGLSWLVGHLGPIFSNIVKMTLGIFIFLVAIYYLFKDGAKFKEKILSLSPLKSAHNETIFSNLSVAINSVIKGKLAIGLIQGLLTALGFFIFGVPNAILWGSLAAILALIPGVGTALVFIPAILYLYVTKDNFYALGLLLWGIIAVGLVDNILGPKLVEQGIKLHPFLILLSIFGGISFFGPVGFLLGPLVLSLFFALIEIYFVIRKEHQVL